MHLEEKTLSSETVFEGKIFTITHDTVELENGSTAVRDCLLHHGGVCVLPVTENNEVYLVKQFRYPFRTVTLEAPAGKLEKGEDPAAADTPRRAAKDYAFLQKHLTGAFGVPVRLSSNAAGKGRLTFSFKNDAELEKIIAIFDRLKE